MTNNNSQAFQQGSIFPAKDLDGDNPIFVQLSYENPSIQQEGLFAKFDIVVPFHSPQNMAIY